MSLFDTQGTASASLFDVQGTPLLSVVFLNLMVFMHFPCCISKSSEALCEEHSKLYSFNSWKFIHSFNALPSPEDTPEHCHDAISHETHKSRWHFTTKADIRLLLVVIFEFAHRLHTGPDLYGGRRQWLALPNQSFCLGRLLKKWRQRVLTKHQYMTSLEVIMCWHCIRMHSLFLRGHEKGLGGCHVTHKNMKISRFSPRLWWSK